MYLVDVHRLVSLLWMLKTSIFYYHKLGWLPTYLLYLLPSLGGVLVPPKGWTTSSLFSMVAAGVDAGCYWT